MTMENFTDINCDHVVIDFAFAVYGNELEEQLEHSIDELCHYIKSVIDDDTEEEIEFYLKRAKRNGKKKAVQLFIRKFKDLEDKTKYEELWDYAKEHGDNKLKSILCLNTPGERDRLKWRTWKEKVQKNLKKFKEIQLANTEILTHLVNLETLLQADIEIVQQDLANQGNIKAVYRLLKIIDTRHDDWYAHLLTVLIQAKVDLPFDLEDCLRELIDSDANLELEEMAAKVKELLSQEEIEERIGAAALPEPPQAAALGDEEDGLALPSPSSSSPAPPPDLVPSVLNIPHMNDLGSRDDPDGGESVDFNIVEHRRPATGNNDNLQLRRYQDELAAPGLAGQNCVIYAPTGSGKTHVAIKIALEHLRSNAARRKVAFLVPNKPLAEQQTKQFRKYLQPQYMVGDLIGGETASVDIPLPEMMVDHDVVVMTAQIVVNSLKARYCPLRSIREFSLIIFDECHHCDKNHPYNEIMLAYFKEQQLGHMDLPQIIGLTASLGTNKASETKQALEHVLDMCANLNAHQLVKVRDEIRNLITENQLPTDEIMYCEAKDYDHAGVCLQRLMEICEQKVNTITFGITDTSPSSKTAPPAQRGSHKYTNFVNGDLRALMLEMFDRKENRIELQCCIECLDKYNRALIMGRLIRSKDAKEYILRELWNDVWKPSCQFEEKMKQEFMAVQEAGFSGEEKNPALERLRETIDRQFYDKPNSRVLIFVKERAYTLALCDWFQGALPELKTDIVVGAQASAGSGGQTQNLQQAVLNKFRVGDVKIVICTSVLEEGLDVPECNLVIRYGYVTNETAMVQTKGRGRALNARYIVIVPTGEEWLADKEKVNKKRNEMMIEAAEIIADMSIVDFQRQIRQRQTLAMKQRELKLKYAAEIENKKSEKSYNLECLSCGASACHSGDFRLIEKAHHVVLSKEIIERIVVKPMANPKTFTATKTTASIMCGNCQKPWGSLIYYNDTPFPNLAIANFALINVDNRKEILRKKKWKDAPFSVKEIEIDEIIKTMDDRGAAWVRQRSI